MPLSPTVGPFLEAWLELRGDSPGPFFCPIDRVGTLRLPKAMTGEAIRQLLERRRVAAGLAAMSPHDLRRTYASDLADLPAVQQLLGHASPATTSRYDRRGDRARRAAAERLHLVVPSATPDVDRESPGRWRAFRRVAPTSHGHSAPVTGSGAPYGPISGSP